MFAGKMNALDRIFLEFSSAFNRFWFALLIKPKNINIYYSNKEFAPYQYFIHLGSYTISNLHTLF